MSAVKVSSKSIIDKLFIRKHVFEKVISVKKHSRDTFKFKKFLELQSKGSALPFFFVQYPKV